MENGCIILNIVFISYHETYSMKHCVSEEHNTLAKDMFFETGKYLSKKKN